jgi:hypothetical protein
MYFLFKENKDPPRVGDILKEKFFPLSIPNWFALIWWFIFEIARNLTVCTRRLAHTNRCYYFKNALNSYPNVE